MRGKNLEIRGLRAGTQAHMIPMLTSMTDHMKLKDAYQLKSVLSAVRLLSSFALLWMLAMRVSDADCKYAIRTTSTAATKTPKLKVMMRIIFCFFGKRMLVRMGIGKNSMARSVMMLSGAEER